MFRYQATARPPRAAVSVRRIRNELGEALELPQDSRALRQVYGFSVAAVQQGDSGRAMTRPGATDWS